MRETTERWNVLLLMGLKVISDISVFYSFVFMGVCVFFKNNQHKHGEFINVFTFKGVAEISPLGSRDKIFQPCEYDQEAWPEQRISSWTDPALSPGRMLAFIQTQDQKRQA